MHAVFALLCFVVVIHWLVFPYPSGLLHWHCGNLTIAPVPAKQAWWIWINTSCEFIMNDRITTTKQSTTKPCAYFLGYTVRTQTMMTSWHGHDFAVLALCTGNIPITGRFPHKRVIWYFFVLCLIKLLKTVRLPVIWDVMTTMWRHYASFFKCTLCKEMPAWRVARFRETSKSILLGVMWPSLITR